MKKLLLATSLLAAFLTPMTVVANTEEAFMKELRAELAKELGLSESEQNLNNFEQQFEQELKKEFAKGFGQLSNELMEIDIEEYQIMVTSDVDQLIITDITINRGNCYGWNVNKEMETLEEMIPLQEKKLVNIREERLKSNEQDLWNEMEKELQREINDSKIELKAYQRDKGMKLSYGEKKGLHMFVRMVLLEKSKSS